MNKEGAWEECIESSASLKVSPNKLKVKSLIDTATGRVEFIVETKIKESNANYIFESYYSSVLELLHALVLLYGYKVSNHLCLGYYLRDILKNQNLFRLFDDCRFKRNSLVYYGRKMDFETAKQSIENSKKLIAKLNSSLNHQLGKN